MLDPQIPLSYKPPEIASPLQTVGGLMQLRSQITENALRSAQIQEAKQRTAEYEQQVQKQRLANQSDQKLTDMFSDPAAQADFAKGNYDRIWGAGISPDIANTAIKNHIDMRTSLSSQKTADIARAATGRAEAGALFKNAGLPEVPDADIPNIYASGRSNLIKNFPEFSGNLPESVPPGAEGRKALLNMQAANGTLLSALEEEAKRRGTEAETQFKASEAAKNAASIPHLAAQTALANAQAGEVGQPKPGVDVPFSPEVEKQKERVAAAGRAANTFQLGPRELTGATPQDKLAQIPASERAVVQGVLSGRIPIPNSRSGSPTAYGNQLRTWAMQVDPDWTDQRNKLYTEFNSNQTKTGQALQSTNTLIGHLGTLYDLTHELNASGGNTNSQTVNAVVRRVQQEFGDPKITNVKTALQAVANESERLYVGGVGSEQGRAEFQKALDTAIQSPQQAEGQIHTAVKLLGSRVKATRIPYDRMMKDYAKETSFLSPEAKSTLVEMGLNPHDVEFGKAEGGGSTKAIVQHSPSTGAYRYSMDGGNTWQPGQPPNQ